MLAVVAILKRLTAAIAALDPYFNNVSLLLTANGLDGTGNRTFVDSASGLPVSVGAGQPTQGSFNPFNPNYTGYFNGTSSYLSAAASSDFLIGTGPYTVEMYVNILSSGTVLGDFLTTSLATTGNSFNIHYSPSEGLWFGTVDRSLRTSFSWTPQVSTWNHIAACRDAANKATLFINGSAVATTTNSTANFSQSGLYLGSKSLSSYYSGSFNGAASMMTSVNSNLLISSSKNIGTVEFWFRVPDFAASRVLWGYVGSTSQWNYGNFSVETNGTLRINADLGSGWGYTISTTTVNANTWYHFAYTNDGTARRVFLNGTDITATFNSGAGGGPGGVDVWPSKTIEMFNTAANGITVGNEKILIGAAKSAGGTAGYFTGLISNFRVVKGQALYTSSFTPPATNLEIYTGSGITTELLTLRWPTLIDTSYRNTTFTYDGTVSVSGTNMFGTNITAQGNFQVTQLRFIKGYSAYSGNFTPATRLTMTPLGVPLSAISLLTLQNGAFVDLSQYNRTLTTGGSLTLSPIDGSYSSTLSALSSRNETPTYNATLHNSVYFDGSSYLSAANAGTNFGTGDFTSECWVNSNSQTLTGGWSGYFSAGSYLNTPFTSSVSLNGSATLEFWFNATATGTLIDFGEVQSSNFRNSGIYVDASTRRLSLFGDHGATYQSSPNTTTVIPDGWSHIALVNNAGVVKFYFNGQDISSLFGGSRDTVFSYLISYTAPIMYIGAVRGWTNSIVATYGGAISNLRIVKSALYTSSFTPSRTPLTTASAAILTLNTSTIVDSSTNNITITNNNSVSTILTSPFNRGILDTRSSIGSTSGLVLAECDNRYVVLSSSTQPPVMSTQSTMVPNAWNHLALTRNSNNLTLYVNGSAVSNTTYSTNLTDNNINIGDSVDSGMYVGSISNLRIVKGSALYTSNFTPSVSGLTSLDGTGYSTSLLTCQSNVVVDNSSGNLALSSTGNPTVTSFNPFGAMYSDYKQGFYGGSAYFDGSSYLTSPNSANFNFGTGDLTVEAWIYPTTASTSPCIFDCRASGNEAGGFIFNILTDYKLQVFRNVQLLASSSSVIPNTWNHIAFTRASGTSRLWLNGVQVGSVADSNSYTTQNCFIGAAYTGTNNQYTGYISNLRIVKGSAVYTAAFTPPKAPVTNIPNTSLLLNFSNAGIYDITRKNNLIQYGTASVSQSARFGVGGMYFDGSSYLTSPSNSAIALGTGDFTVEGWIYPTANAKTFPTIFEIGNHSTASGVVFLQQKTVGGNVPSVYSGAFFDPEGTPSLTLSAWNHLVYQRSSGNLKIFVNGIGSSNIAFTNNISTSVPSIGYAGVNNGGANYYYTGYIDDLRITKGIARYQSNFSVPISELPSSNVTQPDSDPYFSNVSLLLRGDGLSGAQNNTFRDSSTNNSTVTRSGNTTQGSFSPFSPNGNVYNVGEDGGSLYGDGVDGSYAYVTQPAIASGDDFTVEFWTYLLAYKAVAAPRLTQNSDDRNTFYFGNNNGVLVYYDGVVRSVGTLDLNKWYHIAVSRQSGTLRTFINGQIGSTHTGNTAIQNAVRLGLLGAAASGAGAVNGYMSNFRMVKGLAVYTQAFTPPTSPVTLVSNGGATPSNAPTTAQTSLLLNFTDAGIYDLVANNNVITLGNARVDTSVKKFGTGSLYFDGTGDYLSVPSTSQFNFGRGNWTVEFWVYPMAYGGTIVGGQLFGTTNGTTTGYSITLGQDINTFRVISNASGVWADDLFAGTGNGPSLNTWTHFAVVRDGSVLAIYKNGTRVATKTDISTYNFSGTTAVIGRFNEGANTRDFNGYIDDLRVTRNIARYTSNFNVPTAPYPIEGTGYRQSSASVSIEYLLIAGGGAGGALGGGGGGAGGFVTGTATLSANDSISVLIGSGAAYSTTSYSSGGGSLLVSSLLNVTAVGGGGGGSYIIGRAGQNGGSGGGGGVGGSGQGGPGGLGTAGQGNNGGSNHAQDTFGQSGGGGGAGAVGSNGVFGAPGAGGAGLSNNWSGSTIFYAGGGGGETGVAGIAGGNGGNGGGGRGNGTTGFTSGTTNTGGGGGGGGGNGGSGVAIIRYLGSRRARGGVITSSGGYTIHTFTTTETFRIDL